MTEGNPRAAREAAAARVWSEAEWRNPRSRPFRRSVYRCETASSWALMAPPRPRSAAEVVMVPFRCWNPSCRRCGPTVGAQDLARLEPAITGRRWLYAVLTLGPREVARGAHAARARHRRALRQWRGAAEELVGPSPARDRSIPILARDLFALEHGERLDSARDIAARLAWLERARDALPPPRGRRYSGNPYHVAATAWTDSMLRAARHRWGDLRHVVTWERTRRGIPHANVLIGGDGIDAELAELGDLRDGTAKGGRPTRYSPTLRGLFRRWQRQAGFGPVAWVEVAEARSPAVAMYVAKLARELMAPGVKGQAPDNRPRGFRRYSASKGLLAPRLYPRRRGKDEEPGHLALVHGEHPTPETVARAVARWGADAEDHERFRSIAAAFAAGREAPSALG